MINPSGKTILYVDDDEDDRELLSEAIRQTDADVNIVCAENGLKAISYLDNIEQNKTPRPCLIVLDLNMPYLDGKKTFERIKTKPAFKNVPIIIYTSSQNPNDKTFFSNEGVELLSKPHNFSLLNDIAQHMLQHCL